MPLLYGSADDFLGGKINDTALRVPKIMTNIISCPAMMGGRDNLAGDDIMSRDDQGRGDPLINALSLGRKVGLGQIDK